MTLNIKKCISEINRINSEIGKAKEQIATLPTNQYNEEVAQLRQFIRTSQHHINIIKDKWFTVNFQDIINEAAVILDTPVDDLKIYHTTTADSKEDISSEQFIEKIKTNQNRSVHRRDYLNISIANNKNPLGEILVFSNPLHLDATQADGKPMSEHCYVHKTKKGETRLGIDNYKNLALRFQIKNIISQNGTLRDKTSQAIFGASEDNLLTFID